MNPFRKKKHQEDDVDPNLSDVQGSSPMHDDLRIPVDVEDEQHQKNEKHVIDEEIVEKTSTIKRVIPKGIHFYIIAVVCGGLVVGILLGTDDSPRRPKSNASAVVALESAGDATKGARDIAIMASGVDAANAASAPNAKVLSYLNDGIGGASSPQSANVVRPVAVGSAPNALAQPGSLSSLPPPPGQTTGVASPGSSRGNNESGASNGGGKSSFLTEQLDIVKSKLVKLTGAGKSSNSEGGTGSTPSANAEIAALRSSRQANADSLKAYMANSAKANDGANNALLRNALNNTQPTNPQTAAAVSEEWSKDNDQIKPVQMIKANPAPANCNILHQGKIIPAVMEVALNSDLPGNITGLVTQNVYDSICGNRLLIPKGSRFYGQYGSKVQNGQTRLMAGINRIIMPNGVTIDLGQMNVVDGEGATGVPAEVNSHILKQVSAGIMLAIITGGIDYGTSKTTSVSGGTYNSGVTSAGQVMNETSKRALDRFTNIQPTLTVPKGHRFNISVNKDIQLPTYRQ